MGTKSSGARLRSEPVPAVLIGVLLADALEWPRSETPSSIEGDPADLINSMEIGEDGVVHLLGGSDRQHVATLDARELIRGGRGGLDEELSLTVSEALGQGGMRTTIHGPVVPKVLEQSKLVCFIPTDHLGTVSSALFSAGAGVIGEYDYCSFQAIGTGTFRGSAESSPTIGAAGEVERVEEVRLETVCSHRHLSAAIRAYLAAHPYETPAYDVVELTTPGATGAGRLVTVEGSFGAREVVDAVKSSVPLEDIWLSNSAISGESVQSVAITVGPLADLIPALVHESPRPADLVLCGSAEEWEVEVVRALGASVATVDVRAQVPRLRANVASSLTRSLGMAVLNAGGPVAQIRPSTTHAATHATGESRPAASSQSPQQQSLPMDGGKLKLHLSFDGGSRGNPGPAAGSFVIFDEDGIEVERQGLLIGRATNNVAEWTGLMRGVERAVAMGATELAIRGDSQLAIRQLLGEYRVKHPDLKPFHAATINSLSGLKSWTAVHVLRDKNAEADALVNETLDAGRNLP